MSIPSLRWNWRPHQSEVANIWHVSVALGRIPVPAKHRVYNLCELITARFIDAAGIYLKVLQAVAFSLFTTELYLAIASLALARTVYQVLESDLLCSPSVRKYGILGYIALKELGLA